MSRTIITHVGTTTLTRIEQTPRGRQLVERLNTMFAGGNNPPEADLTASVTALTTHLHYLWTEVWNGTSAEDQRERRKVLPAELASLSLLALQPSDRVVLLASETPEGRFCAWVLERLLRLSADTTLLERLLTATHPIAPDFPTCTSDHLSLVEIAGLRVHADSRFDNHQPATAAIFVRKGLVHYVDAIWDIYNGVDRGQKLVFNVTGGYKGMIPIARDVAMLLADHHRTVDATFTCELCYLYEESSELIVYGVLPIEFVLERALREQLTAADPPDGAPVSGSWSRDHPRWEPFFIPVPGQSQPTRHQRSPLGEVILALYKHLQPEPEAE